MQKVTPARAPLVLSRFSLKSSVSSFQFLFHLAAPAREDCLALAATIGQPDCTLSAAVRLPFSFFIETRGESETYKKDGTDKDYTTNT
ncbi:hypothetical protein TNCV_4449791 [Trichonephila clavipes]|nr:hypothetical protein TNCV_4449791 [Trichonephila clavipes]